MGAGLGGPVRSEGRGVKRAAVLLGPPALFLLAFFFLPLGLVLAKGLAVDPWAWIGGAYVRDRLLGATTQAILSVALTMALAIPLAWFHHRNALPMGRAQLAIHAAPFVLPVFVVVFGIQGTFGAIPPLAAIVVAHAYYNYGFAARLLHTALERRPHRLEEAAMLLGATPRQAFRRVTLPLLLPSFGAAALLVFLFSFTSFGVVLFLGNGQYGTLETLMYEVLQGAFRRVDRAAALGLLQLVINAAVLAIYFRLLRRNRFADRPRVRAKAGAAPRAVAWLLVAAALIPAMTVLVGGFRVQGVWSLEPWRALLSTAHPGHLPGFHLGAAVLKSLGYAVASATLAVILSAALAYGARRTGRWRPTVDLLTALPLGTSSLLTGFGFMLTFGVAGFVDVWMGRALIVCAHALIAFPFTARTLLPALDDHDGRLDEAASLLGASPLQVVRRIHWPMLRPTVLVATGFAVAMSLGDFGASLLLQNQANRSLSVWIASFGLDTFDPLMRAQAVALAGLLMVLAAAAYVVVERSGGWKNA